MAPQALWLLPPDPLPLPEPEPLPEPLPLPDPLPPLPEPVPPDEKVERGAPPPQLAHENANASTARAAGKFIHENFITLIFTGNYGEKGTQSGMP
jgi:hypothetical protein